MKTYQSFINEGKVVNFTDPDGGNFVVLMGGPGSGKCLKNGTKVLMYDNSLKNVENVEIGDLLLGPDGRPRKVLSTFSGYGQLYKIKQIDGIAYYVNENHVLSLYKSISCDSFVEHEPQFLNISVKDYIEKSIRWRTNFYGYKMIDNNIHITMIDIEKDVEGYYSGFELDGDHQFLLEDFTVTHNSFVSNNLINLNNIKYFNVDSERELVAKKIGLDLNKPEDNEKILKYTYSSTDPRNRTIKQLKTLLNNMNSSQPANIVFDTVGTHTELIKELLELAKDKGYKTTMVYVNCDIDTALERNRKRDRRLSDDVVIDYHERVQRTFDQLFKLYDNAWVVDTTHDFNPVKRGNIVHKLK